VSGSDFTQRGDGLCDAMWQRLLMELLVLFVQDYLETDFLKCLVPRKEKKRPTASSKANKHHLSFVVESSKHCGAHGSSATDSFQQR
jgi:hypothetical protein